MKLLFESACNQKDDLGRRYEVRLESECIQHFFLQSWVDFVRPLRESVRIVDTASEQLLEGMKRWDQAHFVQERSERHLGSPVLNLQSEIDG